jgi:hypothetical protein
MIMRKENIDNCGCQLIRDEKGLHMIDCPLHAAAPELYFVAGLLADVSDAKISALTHDQIKNLMTDMRNEARAAKTKAEGRAKP